jgi:hypothetical protein
MRVNEGGDPVREAPPVARSRTFGDALRRVREGAAGEARGAAAREAGSRAASSRRTAGDAKGAGLVARRSGFRDEERDLGTAPPVPSPFSGQATALALAGPVATAELRAVLRALPAAIDASRVRVGGPLSLSLGRALDVDLRAARAGVEVVLRPEPRLARAAEAELPALVASLRARGIAVAKAEVRVRGGDGRRVDVSSPLR